MLLSRRSRDKKGTMSTHDALAEWRTYDAGDIRAVASCQVELLAQAQRLLVALHDVRRLPPAVQETPRSSLMAGFAVVRQVWAAMVAEPEAFVLREDEE